MKKAVLKGTYWNLKVHGAVEGRVHMIKHVKGQKKALKRIKKILNREIPDEELAGLASHIIFQLFSPFLHILNFKIKRHGHPSI